MTFLDPAFLYGLPAALLPILIHLLNRRRAVTVPFSDVALLRQLQQDRMRRVKLRQILLLLLRTFVILLVVLAFSRPALRGRFGTPGGHVRTAAVLLLDDSYGMAYRTPTGRLYDRARARVQEALRLLDGGDRVCLIPFSARPFPLAASEPLDLAALRERLAGGEVTALAPEVRPLLEGAARTLAGLREPNREIYLFSDLARPGWDGVADSLAAFRDVTVYLAAERPARLENLAVTRFAVSNQVVTAGTHVTFDIELGNWGERPEPEVPVRLAMGGQRIEQTVISLQSGERRHLQFRAIPRAPGRFDALVEAGDDPLPLDNLRHLVLDVPGRIRVLLVGETPGDTYYAERAFAVPDSGAPIEARATARNRLTEADLADRDLVMLCDPARLTPAQTDALRRYLARGGCAAIFPGERAEAADAGGRWLSGLLPVRMGPRRGEPGRASSFRALGEMDRGHPLFRDLLPASYEPPRAFASYDLEPAADAGSSDPVRILARFGDGGTALCEARPGAGRVLLCATALDPKWSDLPLRGMFVPLLHRIAQLAVNRTPVFEAFPVGSAIERGASGSGDAAELLSPGGESRRIRAVASAGQEAYRLGPLPEPGIWRIREAGRETDRFASAVDALRGADLSPVSADRLSRIFSKARLRVIGPGDSLTGVVTETRYGRDLWRPCLILALALMAAEMILARTSASRKEE